MPPIPVIASKPNDPVMFTPPGGKEDVYVMMIVDPVNQIFQGIKVADKSPITFTPADIVYLIEVPALGPVLLAL